MWIAVRKRFNDFSQELLLTDEQKTDGATKNHGVRRCLNNNYYGIASDTDNSFLVGSWSKFTRVRPPRDVDVYFELPVSVYKRFEEYQGNKQSALLQEVKSVLEKTYPSTTMSGDGQVVVVRFNTIDIEVAPVFKLTNGRYWVCHTQNGGSYKEADPVEEKAEIKRVDDACSKNLRRLIRMLKTWQRNCNVPIKSFHIEILATEYIQQSSWKNNGYFYYDWLIRDFFSFMLGKVNGYLYAPGTYEMMGLGNAWESRCQSAYARSLKACDYEHRDMVIHAGEEWQKVFGSQIKLSV